MISPVATRRAQSAGSGGAEAVAVELLRLHRPDLAVSSSLLVSRATGGRSNDTFLVSVTDDGTPIRFVLRRQATAGPLEPYDVLREARIMEALAPTTVPTPTVLAVRDGDAHDPRPALLMEYVPGDVPDYRDPETWSDWRNPAHRAAAGRSFFETMHALQQVELDASVVGTLFANEPVSVSDRIARLLDRAVRRSGGQWSLPPIFGLTAAWLTTRAEQLSDDPKVLCHGDYKLGNLIFRDSRVVALIDWELASTGHPLQDVGYACHPIIREQHPDLMAALVPRQAFANLYEEIWGQPLDPWKFQYFVVYALFVHLYTVIMGLSATVHNEGVRLGVMYRKLSQITVHLADEIEHAESGRVL
jgi:aminoglycoside phosphotransferase (APT) family kinase protein